MVAGTLSTPQLVNHPSVSSIHSALDFMTLNDLQPWGHGGEEAAGTEAWRQPVGGLEK